MIVQTLKSTIPAARMLFAFTLLCGLVYPLVVTFLGQTLFPFEANGSLISNGGIVSGSELIAQKFIQPRYLQSRPSAGDYATIPSVASNQSPTSRLLHGAISERRKMLGTFATADLITTSASGLDPHISPESAFQQLDAIKSARRLDESGAEKLRLLVAHSVEYPTFGLLGMARVNVLKLNIQLDSELP